MAPAPAAHAPEAERDLALIEVHTDPPTARLTIDHHEVHNPFTLKTPRSRHPHDVVATLPGLGQARQTITFDRDRDLVLKLGNGSASPRRRRSPPRVFVPAVAVHAGRRAAGYRGSKLKIETEFP